VILEEELQAAWPCRDCTVRGSSFCGTLIDGSPWCPQPGQSHISQVFLSASKDEVIRHNGHGGKDRSGPMVLCEGWAYRFYRFADGRRQILSVLIPGDFFSTSTLLDPHPDFSIQAATDVKICQLGRDDIKRKLAAEPSLCDAFGKLCSAEIDETTSTVIDLNESNSVKRVLGFVQRLVKRLSARGMTIRKGVYEFPLSQADIADATGLTANDVSRAIENLRQRGIVDILNGKLTVLDSAEFEKHAMAPTR
jgi:CRP/FNR family transcriptional regulator, anaerobic regulatory protein